MCRVESNRSLTDNLFGNRRSAALGSESRSPDRSLLHAKVNPDTEISGAGRPFDVPAEWHSEFMKGRKTPAMKRILFSLFGMLFFASLAHAIDAGDAEQEVRTTLGNPVAARKKPDGAQVWRFKDGTTVWLAAEGIVQKIAGPASGSRLRRDASSDWVPVSSLTPRAATRSGSEIKHRASDTDMRSVRNFALIGGLALVASILWSSVSPVRAGGAWFLSEVFVPVVSAISDFVTGGRFRGKRAWRAAPRSSSV